MNNSKETKLKRRDVLKRGAVATGTAMVGGTAMMENVVAAHSACNVRIMGVDDCSGKNDENTLKQGGRQATAYVLSCDTQAAKNNIFEVVGPTGGEGVCPEPKGDADVNCYEMRYCFNNAILTFCVRGTLPEGTFWQVTESEKC